MATPLAAFRLMTPNAVYPVRYTRARPAHLDVSGDRGQAIIRALHDQLGVLATAVTPFGLAGSGGSTPLKITVKADASAEGEESCIFGKLYAATHVRSDRWYKLGRALLYGRLEDEKPFHTVRRLVQYEDYILRLFSDAGLPVPHPLGIVEITPEREYLLVTEFIAGAKEAGEAEIDDSVIDQGLSIVRRMWDIGMAHRDIKPANLLVRNGTLFLIDSAFAEVRPSPWRQAVDLANMLLVLALRTDAERVYRRARLQFSDEEIAEAFAATRGLTMPTQLRRMLRQQGAICTRTSCACSLTGCRPCASSAGPGAGPGSPSSPWPVPPSSPRSPSRSSGHRCEARPPRGRGAADRPHRRAADRVRADRRAERARRLRGGRRRHPVQRRGAHGPGGAECLLGAVPGGHAPGLALLRHGRRPRLGALLAGLRPRRRARHRGPAHRVLLHVGGDGDPERPAGDAPAGAGQPGHPLYVGRRYYLFEGGCITVVFRLSGENRGEPLAVATQGLGAVPRDELRALVHEKSGGRLHLDPPGDGGR
ncbi:hypothetical protein [Blastococcus brunescens]|uniref:Non-specific serine/threonine protein kinase n=1 Tax=Blastococcus brunescens TaxID=1564165 RepID=A0ABZ1B027_9ACTN|nr:hypothetical protein [Blastococcus sp. BMG 8361]WRL63258.1 hypothetical protein U6N30_26395 [Blastococcus sp. BMG 8361]